MSKKDRVVFVENEYGVTAVFPDIPWDESEGTVTCYAHLGQHGGCDLEWAREQKPAKDYAALKKELESIGYELEVCGMDALN